MKSWPMRQPEFTTTCRQLRVAPDHDAKRVLLVGPGFRFLSGLSVYTCQLANSLADSHDVSVLLIDRLVPKFLYPGAARVGHELTSLSYDERVRQIGEIDWYWGRSMSQVARTLRIVKPDVIVLQWWTAATLHTYLMLARIAKKLDIPIVIEFHEAQDTGEAQIPLAAAYCRKNLARLVSQSAGVICHNEHDVDLLTSTFGAQLLSGTQVTIAPHGPYDHVAARRSVATERIGNRTRLLFFGLIRPYKGLEDLIYALDGMSDLEASQFDIDIIGETWEQCTLPAEAIAASRHRDRINFVNRYVSDAEAATYFERADAVVLPYRRGSSSGPLQIAMSTGLHVVMYAVGGLVEAVRDYDGAVLVPPNDVHALRNALLDVVARRDERFDDPHSWESVQRAIEMNIATEVRT